MEEYRAIHHAKYLERTERGVHIHKIIDDIKNCTRLEEIHAAVSNILETIQEPVNQTDFGLKLLDAINTNKAIITQLDNHFQVRMSREIQENVNIILGFCGITDTIDIQYDMDCSRDEELARQLAAETPPPVARRPRGRPRRT
jgi:hypothetical protein